MLLSIIVPIYNVQDYIVRCMEGVLHQDLEDYEVIAVDDGSPDRSVERLQEYLAAHPEEAARVRLIRKENGGLSDARNAGITVATGEYLWFVDSDDTIAENCLSRLYERASANQLDLMLFDEVNLEERDGQFVIREAIARADQVTDQVLTGSDLFITLRMQHAFYGSACGYWVRRSILEDNHLLFEKGILHEDELFTPQAMHYAVRAQYVSEQPYIRYIREGSITTSENIERMIDGYGAVVTGLLRFADTVVQREDERRWLHEDIVSLAQITLGEASKCRHLSSSAQEMLRTIRRSLKEHQLSLGILFTLYTFKNRILQIR